MEIININEIITIIENNINVKESTFLIDSNESDYDFEYTINANENGILFMFNELLHKLKEQKLKQFEDQEYYLHFDKMYEKDSFNCNSIILNLNPKQTKENQVMPTGINNLKEKVFLFLLSIFGILLAIVIILSLALGALNLWSLINLN